MEHHAPHPNPAFEGYYNKFDLTSGAHVIIVISKVHRANSKANAFTFTYVPEPGSSSASSSHYIFQKEIFVDAIHMQQAEGQKYPAFALEVPGLGIAKHNADDTTEYHFEHSSFTFSATTTSRLPWPGKTETPEGWLVRLPLPLHWHVQSLASSCELNMTMTGYYDHLSKDISDKAIVHQEKNWATSFPSAHMWVQARDGDKVFCCAGGKILGVNAFLVGYRSNDLEMTFRPPFALRLPGFGPFMSTRIDWETRTFELSVQSFRQKITMKATAPEGTFYSLAAPFAEGHRSNFLGQSQQARVEVKIYESGWLGSWRLVREHVFENAGLEFGAGYYPPAGSDKRFN